MFQTQRRLPEAAGCRSQLENIRRENNLEFKLARTGHLDYSSTINQIKQEPDDYLESGDRKYQGMGKKIKVELTVDDSARFDNAKYEHMSSPSIAPAQLEVEELNPQIKQETIDNAIKVEPELLLLPSSIFVPDQSVDNEGTYKVIKGEEGCNYARAIVSENEHLSSPIPDIDRFLKHEEVDTEAKQEVNDDASTAGWGCYQTSAQSAMPDLSPADSDQKEPRGSNFLEEAQVSF